MQICIDIYLVNKSAGLFYLSCCILFDHFLYHLGHGSSAYFIYLCSALRITGNLRKTRERKVSWFGRT